MNIDFTKHRRTQITCFKLCKDFYFVPIHSSYSHLGSILEEKKSMPTKTISMCVVSVANIFAWMSFIFLIYILYIETIYGKYEDLNPHSYGKIKMKYKAIIHIIWSKENIFIMSENITQGKGK